MEKSELYQRIQQLRLMDDVLMVKCFEDNIECTELMLHLIIKKPVLQVESVRPQWLEHSVGLDIFARNGDGRRYNVKVLRDDTPLSEHRVGDYISLLDRSVVYSQEDSFEIYIIYIQERGSVRKAVYRGGCMVDFVHEGMLYGCSPHVLYVNGERKNRSPLGQLMFDFSYEDPSQMNYALLADRVRYFKETPAGMQAMYEMLAKAKRI